MKDQQFRIVSKVAANTIRIILLSAVALPMIGALRPIAGLADGGQSAFQALQYPPEMSTILQDAWFALWMSAAATASFLLLAPWFVTRRAANYVERLTLLLTALFFVPMTLKVFAFEQFWGGTEAWGLPPIVLFYVWTVSFGCVFFWAALLTYVNATGIRNTLDAMFEIQCGLSRYTSLLRQIVEPVFIAWVCCFAFIFFGGLEIRLLLPGMHPVGDVINDLFGGREIEAAEVSAASLGIATIIITLMYIIGRNVFRRVPLPK